MSFRVFLALLAGAIVGAGVTLTQGVLATKEKSESLPLKDLQTFVEILNRVKTDYVEPVTDDVLLENAVRGMLSGLDPHSAYLDKEEFAEVNVTTTGKFGGLGIEVGLYNGFVRVIAPIDDTPAARAGIEAGDLIVKIDTTPVKGMSLTDAVKRMRGEPGTKINLTVAREGEAQPLEFEITRDIIKVASVRSRMLEPGMGYIRVSTFSSVTGRTLDEEFAKLTKQGELKGLVLDLRNNPGGVLNAAVQVSDAFLEQGTIVSIKGRVSDSNRNFDAKPGDLMEGKPIVVLINGGSASASEIVAGALQDHKRALLAGSQTFGKGSVQTIVPLHNDSAIKLTTARYFTPNGRSIQAAGIEPDIAIRPVKVTRAENPAAALRISEDDLENRLDGDANRSAEDAAEKKRQSDEATALAESDYALYEALNLLKGMVIVGSR